MAGFLYYLPGAKSADPNTLIAAGLDYAVRPGETVSHRAVMNGPDQGAGIVAAIGDVPNVGYYPDRQTWVRMRRAEAWLGWETASPPGPGDLERPTVVALYEVPLGDGARWSVPTGLTADGDSPLPKARSFDDEGRFVRTVQTAYQPLYCLADEVREAIEQGGTLGEQREVEACLQCLQVNYRLGLDEASALELLTDKALQEIQWALVDYLDWPDVIAMRERIKADG